MSKKRSRLEELVVMLLMLCSAVRLESLYKNQPTRSLMYNTTSGIYQAQLVAVDHPTQAFLNALLAHEHSVFEGRHHAADAKCSYVHKLIAVPYGEKPERFQRAILRKYEPGVHPVQEQIVCYQLANMTSYGLFQLKSQPKMTEDCLTANVYMPVDSENKLRDLSVIVHVHGGSNMVGGAFLFDGSVLAALGKVVVVTINYRLGVLGFLSDGSKKYPGNYGLRDQMLAIKWVRNNCHVLNCNPNKITLWGHSAGAGDIAWLAISPNANNLFQRAIIQSGSALSYWALDKLPFERYKSLRTYFNCTFLPEAHSEENGAMTRLIDECLKKMPLDKIYSFKFALIDAPGPINDAQLGKDALITAKYSGKDMIVQNFPQHLSILTGINAVEGFAFEGFFSTSVKFWSHINVTNELMLTLERFSLLVREKCIQNTAIMSRLKIGDFYERTAKKMLRENLSEQSKYTADLIRRLKSILLNSHTIFDSGFIELTNTLYDAAMSRRQQQQQPTQESVSRNKNANSNNLFVYEYLHENGGSSSNLRDFKSIVKNTTQLSTHFDGIDFIFGKLKSPIISVFVSSN